MKPLKPNTIRVERKPYGACKISKAKNAERWPSDNIFVRVFQGRYGDDRWLCSEWTKYLFPKGKIKSGLYEVRLVKVRRKK